MHFMSYGGVRAWVQDSNPFHKLVVVCALYFAINSNIYSSVVLATYVGSNLLLDLIEDIREQKFNLKSYCIRNWVSLFIIMCWFGANILESTGDRAGGLRKSLIGNVPITLGFSAFSFIAINVFITICELIIFILWRKRNKNLNSTAVRFLCYIGIQELYLILLSASIEAYYVIRPEVTLCKFFYIFMAMIACFNELVKADKKYVKTLFVLLGTVILLFIRPGVVYNPCNFSLLPYENCAALANDMISQIKTAKEQGKSEMVLVIPKYNNYENWPYNESIGERITEALYRHKVLDCKMSIKEVVISEEKNEELGISPDMSILSLLNSFAEGMW